MREVEEALGAAADRQRAFEELGRERVLVERRVHGAESGERHDEAPGRDALRRFEQLERLLVAFRRGRVVAELVLRRAQVVVGDRQFVVALGIGFRQFDDALGVGQGLVESRGLVEAAELVVGLHARILRQDAKLLYRHRGLHMRFDDIRGRHRGRGSGRLAAAGACDPPAAVRGGRRR